jgi:hypothetical protein
LGGVPLLLLVEKVTELAIDLTVSGGTSPTTVTL